MTGIDTNVLMDLMVSSSEYHQQAVKGVLQLSDSLCTTPTNIGECLRLLTHKKLFSRPLKLPLAIKTLQSLLESYQIKVLDEDPDWWKSSLFELDASSPGLNWNEVFYARIALCFKGHQVKRIYTRDTDFMKYPFLKVIHPLNT